MIPTRKSHHYTAPSSCLPLTGVRGKLMLKQESGRMAHFLWHFKARRKITTMLCIGAVTLTLQSSPARGAAASLDSEQSAASPPPELTGGVCERLDRETRHASNTTHPTTHESEASACSATDRLLYIFEDPDYKDYADKLKKIGDDAQGEKYAKMLKRIVTMFCSILVSPNATSDNRKIYYDQFCRYDNPDYACYKSAVEEDLHASGGDWVKQVDEKKEEEEEADEVKEQIPVEEEQANEKIEEEIYTKIMLWCTRCFLMSKLRFQVVSLTTEQFGAFTDIFKVHFDFWSMKLLEEREESRKEYYSHVIHTIYNEAMNYKLKAGEAMPDGMKLFVPDRVNVIEHTNLDVQSIALVKDIIMMKGKEHYEFWKLLMHRVISENIRLNADMELFETMLVGMTGFPGQIYIIINIILKELWTYVRLRKELGLCNERTMIDWKKKDTIKNFITNEIVTILWNHAEYKFFLGELGYNYHHTSRRWIRKMLCERFDTDGVHYPENVAISDKLWPPSSNKLKKRRRREEQYSVDPQASAPPTEL